MNNRHFDERDIHLALDGELPEEERHAFSSWLDANPDMKARHERFAGDAAALRAALHPVMAEPVPPKLRAMVESAAPAPKGSWLARAAAAAAILVVGLGIGYLAGNLAAGPARTPAVRMAYDALEAHLVYAAEKLHVVEVGADQKDHLVGWLSKRVGTRLVAPDLEGLGYSLIGGRLLPAEEGVAAQFMYQDQAGLRVSIYVSQGAGASETGFRLYEHDGARAFYWLEDGFCYAVAGALPEQPLLGIANEAYRQLLQGISS
jgi:anti-sigma factor RsiW